MTEATQTVVETPAPASPGVTVENARAEGEDLSSLLAEYDNTTKPAPVEQPKPAPQTQAPDPTARLSMLEAAVLKQDITKTINQVRGDMDPGFFDDGLVKGWLNAQADANPKLNEIFQNRYANEALYDRTVKALQKEFTKRYSKLPDRAATEDVEAVAAAVRGSSNRLPEGRAPAYGNQSNAEFRKSVKEKYGYDPGV